MSCTQSVRVPEADYGELRPGERVYLDVRTADARYRATQFSVTDSTIVIEAVELGPNTYPSRNAGFDYSPHLPFAIPLSSVESITRNEKPSDASGVLLVVAIAGAVCLFALWVFGQALSGIDSGT
mgnify:CR=1 FL=1